LSTAISIINKFVNIYKPSVRLIPVIPHPHIDDQGHA
jgi:hypothetical protein